MNSPTQPPNLLVRRLINSTRYSLQGLRALLREEAFRVELAFMIPMMPLAFWLGDTVVEQAVLVASLIAILIVEALNTAIEVVVDRISIERHPESGKAKDIGSCAVMLSIILAVVVWGLLLSN